jgi:hypothetical protein
MTPFFLTYLLVSGDFEDLRMRRLPKCVQKPPKLNNSLENNNFESLKNIA